MAWQESDQSEFTYSEEISITLGTLFVVQSIIYPIFIGLLLWCKLKPVIPEWEFEVQHESNYSPDEFWKQFDEQNPDKTLGGKFPADKWWTKEEREDFDNTWGAVLADIDEERIGKTNSILAVVVPLLRELSCVIAITMLAKTNFSIFIFMYSVLLHGSWFVSVMPQRENNYLEAFNFLMQLYLTYLLLLMTPFVDREHYVSINNQFIIATIVMIVVNLVVINLPLVKLGWRHYRRYLYRKAMRA